MFDQLPRKNTPQMAERLSNRFPKQSKPLSPHILLPSVETPYLCANDLSSNLANRCYKNVTSLGHNVPDGWRWATRTAPKSPRQLGGAGDSNGGPRDAANGQL